jgi:hypothetical protein
VAGSQMKSVLVETVSRLDVVNACARLGRTKSEVASMLQARRR